MTRRFVGMFAALGLMLSMMLVIAGGVAAQGQQGSPRSIVIMIETSSQKSCQVGGSPRQGTQEVTTTTTTTTTVTTITATNPAGRVVPGQSSETTETTTETSTETSNCQNTPDPQ